MNSHVRGVVFSVGYTMDTVFFSWLDIPVDIDQGLQLPQFTLEKTTLYDCSQNYTAGIRLLSPIAGYYYDQQIFTPKKFKKSR